MIDALTLPDEGLVPFRELQRRVEGTADRGRAKALGYILHFVAGLLFALVYYAIFLAIGQSGWWLGAIFGLAHALFSSTALVNLLLPLVHPRMGTPLTGANETAVLEPPGFLMRNYGTRTPIVTVLAHIAYGALVGGGRSATGGSRRQGFRTP